MPCTIWSNCFASTARAPYSCLHDGVRTTIGSGEAREGALLRAQEAHAPHNAVLITAAIGCGCTLDTERVLVEPLRAKASLRAVGVQSLAVAGPMLTEIRLTYVSTRTAVLAIRRQIGTVAIATGFSRIAAATAFGQRDTDAAAGLGIPLTDDWWRRRYGRCWRRWWGIAVRVALLLPLALPAFRRGSLRGSHGQRPGKPSQQPGQSNPARRGAGHAMHDLVELLCVHGQRSLLASNEWLQEIATPPTSCEARTPGDHLTVP